MNDIRKQLKDALRVDMNPDGDGFAARFSLGADFSGFEGHFPGNPVLPGIFLIAACLVAAGEALGAPIKMNRIKSAKFFSPVKPDEPVEITARFDNPDAPKMIRAQLACGERKVAQIIAGIDSSAGRRG